jgi:mxaJ protein
VKFCRSKTGLWLALVLLLASGEIAARELRVCADPNNLPFSNQAREGFENRVVDIVAQDLHATVTYVWWAQRRGNIRNTLGQGLCDLIPGVGTGMDALATTQPYYRSTYVFVTRSDRQLDLRSFDDERLHRLSIGVQMIGDDFSNTPPAHALTRRGIVQNVRGYMLYGDYATQAPVRPIVDDVATAAIDVAIVWGPVAGYFAKQQSVPLRLQPVPASDGASLPMTFSVSMGVRKGDAALQAELDGALLRHQAEIGRLLAGFGIPDVTAADSAVPADRAAPAATRHP